MTQCKKIEQSIDTLLENNKDSEEDDVIRNFSTANENLDKINKMDEFEFNQYHS